MWFLFFNFVQDLRKFILWLFSVFRSLFLFLDYPQAFQQFYRIALCCLWSDLKILAFMCSFLLFCRWVLYALLIWWYFSLFAWVLLLSHFFSAALLLDFSWWASWSNNGFILYVVILLTSGALISGMDSITHIYPLYNSCRCPNFWLFWVLLLGLYWTYLCQFYQGFCVLSGDGLGKAILNLIINGLIGSLGLLYLISDFLCVIHFC